MLTDWTQVGDCGLTIEQKLLGQLIKLNFTISTLPKQRDIFNADIIIWMNTIKSYKYEDTNQAFQAPDKYDIKFDSFNKIDVSKVLNIIKAYAYPFYK